MDTDAITTSPTNSLIDIATTAARLGVSVRHIRRLIQERRIPFIKWGHLIRFDPTDLDRWIDAHRTSTARPASAPMLEPPATGHSARRTSPGIQHPLPGMRPMRRS